jgi:hypothetical protein
MATQQESEAVAISLLLLGELEESLQRSIQATLSMDVTVLEAETRQQIGLTRALSVAMPRHDLSQFANAITTLAKPELAEADLPAEVRRTRSRIIEAVRLQAALLSRARSKLRVLANMLSGPSVLYGPTARPGGSWRI